MKIHGPYGITEDKTFTDGFVAPQGKALSHESEVETAGYRTLKQQIDELIDAGERLKNDRKARYADHRQPTES